MNTDKTAEIARKRKEWRRWMRIKPRRIVCSPNEEQRAALGPLAQLPGTWKSEGKGWNIIALPFDSAQFRYRVLMNQYDEFLRFTFVAPNVPNRGVTDPFTDPEPTNPLTTADQFVATVDYEQTINQIAQEDVFVVAGSTPDAINFGRNGADIIFNEDDGIHHEPGLFLHMLDDRENENINIARLGTIPHGNSVLALGKGDDEPVAGPNQVPNVNAMPILNPDGIPASVPALTLNGDSTTGSIPPGPGFYVVPYAVFETRPFFGKVPPGLEIDNNPFPGFFPSNTSAILQWDNENTVEILESIKLDLDTDVADGNILNIPFIERQADAVQMRSTFWIQRVKEKATQTEKLRLQYVQNVGLDFFDRPGAPGLIRWPHVSINTLEKVSDDPDFERESQCSRAKY